MATQYIYLKGKVKWFRADRTNEWGKWAHVLYLDPDSLKIVQDLQISTPELQGIKNMLKKDEDGYFMSIARPSSRTVKGRIEGLDPPLVLDGSIQLSDGSNPPMRGALIGNGSDVTTKCEVYPYNIPGSKAKGRAMRWASSRIDTLVPFEDKREFTTSEEKQMRGLSEQSPQF